MNIPLKITNARSHPFALFYSLELHFLLWNLTTLFLDYAESMAEDNQVMTMKDWINETDNLLKFRKKEILQNSGKISHKEAIEKAENEYEKYKIIQDKKFISDFDKLLLGTGNINKNKI